MRSRLFGLVGVVALAVGGVGCATGSSVPSGDGGARVDAPADGEPATGDGPAQTDAPGQSDGSQPADGSPADGSPADGSPADGSPADGSQPDAGCTVQNTGPCDPVCQNCPGQKCTIDADTPTLAECVNNGTVAVGGTCTGDADTLDTCAAGLICLQSDQKCHQFCRTNADCTALNAACRISINGTPFLACMPPDGCNPATNTGCTTAGDGCFLGSNDSQTFCFPAGTGGQGVACPTGQECQGGYLCVDRGSGYKCEKVCTVTPPSGCTAPATCQSVSGLTAYGGCA